LPPPRPPAQLPAALPPPPMAGATFEFDDDICDLSHMDDDFEFI
jgi:hypothetical protein